MTVTLRSQLRPGWRPVALLGVLARCCAPSRCSPAPRARMERGSLATWPQAAGAHLLPGARGLAGIWLFAGEVRRTLPRGESRRLRNRLCQRLRQRPQSVQSWPADRQRWLPGGDHGIVHQRAVRLPAGVPAPPPLPGGPDSSQLSDAVAYLEAHPGSVNPITIDIGANDALGLIETTCKLEAAYAAGAPAVFAKIGANLGLILGELRAAAPHCADCRARPLQPLWGNDHRRERAHRRSQRSRGQSRGRGRSALRRSAAALQPAGGARSADDLPADQYVHAARGYPPNRARRQGARRLAL